MHPFFQSGPGQYVFHSYAFGPVVGLVFLLAMVEIVLKGFALWRAARLERTGWFVLILLLNTAGILPIIFLIMTKNEYAKLPKSAVKM